MRLFSVKAAAAALLFLLPGLLPAQTTLAPEVERGRAWLAAQVGSDGRISEASTQLATERQTEAETIETLQSLGAAPGALVQRHAARQPDAGVEHLARQIVALARAGKPVQTPLAELRSYQNGDGGFGGSDAHRSTVLDTSFALVAFRLAGVTGGEDVTRALDYLVGRSGDAARSDWQMGSSSAPYVSAYALLAMQMHSARYSIAAAINAQRAALIAQQGSGRYAETLLDAVAALSLQYGSTGETGLTELRTAIRAAQAADGSWSGDSFLTALALRALSSGVLPPPSTEGRVVLRARDAATLAYLPGVRLTLAERADLNLVSGPDGSLDTGELPPSTYTLSLSKEGYRTRELGQLTLSAGQTRDLGVIDLGRDPTLALLFGRVTDATTATPLAGVAIDVSGAVTASTQTSPDGAYEIVFPNGGDIQVRAARAGYHTVTGTGALVLGQALRFSPALIPDSGQVPSTASLSATIVDASNEAPLAGARLSVGAASALSDGSGRVQLNELAAGAFSATVSLTGYTSAVLSGSLAAGANDAGIIRLMPEAATERSSLSGRITDATNGVAISGATVSISGTNLRASSNTNGDYSIANIPSVPFTAVATAPGYSTQQLSAGSTLHDNFRGDFALQKVANADVVLEGVVMSAPEYDPFVEVGVLGTVKNQGTGEVGVIFNAVITDATGRVVRDVPHVQITLNRTLDDTVIRFAPGETKPITIIWGNLNDAPGDYSVLFRGVMPDGRVVVEGPASYRVRSVTRLGGGILTDPPLIQAGTGQSVKLGADLTNMGNQPIPAGDVKLSITMTAQDDRPPLPPKPSFGTDLLSGSPLHHPVGLTRDAAGNVYTLNSSLPQLVKVAPDGTSTVVRNLPTLSPTNVSLSTPLALYWRAPNLIRLAWVSGWVADLDLDNANTVSNFKAPPTGLSSASAYAFDSASGKEYFGGQHIPEPGQAARPRVLMRNASNQVAVLVDAGLSTGGNSQFGPDGQLYVVNRSPGAIFRVDPVSGAFQAIWVGLGGPSGFAIDPAGNMYVSEDSHHRVQRRKPDGSTDVFATLSGFSISDLKYGRDGLLYGLASDGTIRRFDASGANTIWARSLLTTVSGVAVAEDGDIYAHSTNQIRHLSDATGLVALGNGTQTVSSLMPDGPAGPLIANNTSLLRVVGTGYQTLLTPANHRIRRIAPMGSDVLLGAVDGERPVLARSDRSSFEILASSPFSNNVRSIAVDAAGNAIVVNADSLVRLAPDGTHSFIARFTNLVSVGLDRARNEMWVNSPSEGLLRTDLVTGTKTRLRGYVSNMQHGFAVDAAGALLFSDTSARKLIKYDPATNAFSDYHVIVPNIAPQQLALAQDGTVFVRFSDHSLRRLDASAWTTVDSGYVYDLLVAADGRVGYRKNYNLYRAPAVGETPTLLSVLVETPDVAVWLGDDAFGAYYANRVQLKMLTAAGTTIRNVYGMADYVSVAATDSGDVFVLDIQRNITRVTGGALIRVGRQGYAQALRTRGDTVLMTMRDGIYALNAANNTVALERSIPGWTTDQYGGFGLSDVRTIAFNRTTDEVVVLDAGAVQARYLPFPSANAFAQRSDGSWLVANPSRIAVISPDGSQSGIFAQMPNTYDLHVRADGTVLASTNLPAPRYSASISVLNADGTAVDLIGPRVDTGVKLNSIAERAGSTQIFAVGANGIVFRDENGWLEPFAAGVTSVNSVLPMADGSVLIASTSSTSILEYRDGVTASVADLVHGSRAMCALDSDTLAVVSDAYLSIVDLRGAVNFVAAPASFDPRAILCGSDGAMLIANYPVHKITRAIAGTQQVGVHPGDVVREQIVPMQALMLDGGQRLNFDSWVPPTGGDYEIRVVPLDPSVEGSLLSGIHVGPAAKAQMTVAPTSAPPAEAAIEVNTYLEGADFTRLSRIDRSQLRLAGNSVYPEAMSLDPSGRLWYGVGNALYLAPVGSTSAKRVGTIATGSIQGELPIDSLGRAYVAPYMSLRYELRRIDETGANVRLTDFGQIRVVSMTIDTQDRLFVLTSDNKVYLVLPDGTKSLYATLTGSTPFGITRDGVGGIYVQQRNNRILYIPPTTREPVLMDLRGAYFEYEGVNIAGDCGEGMFMTPMSLPGTGQSGEEHTIVQLVGRTGEIGTVINGKVISIDLTDMDFITYDRFGSRLLIMSESNGLKLYTVPVTCGAIDMDLHVVLPGDQPFYSSDPVASSVLPRANGDIEYVWALRDVNAQGATIRLDSKLLELVRGEDRPAAREAFVMLRNSFQPAPVRLDIDVPTVHVRDLVELNVVLDREEYPQQTPVGIRVPMVNTDNVAKSGLLIVRVEDAAGATVETLIERQQAFEPLESIELTPPFNTGTLRVADYRVVAEIRDELGGVVAQASDDFRVIAGSGGTPTLSSTVATDKPVYQVGEAALIFANVQNLSANLGFTTLTVSERVIDANGATIFTASQPIANLEPSAQTRLQFDLSLAGVAPGFYDVQQEVRSAANELLDAKTTRFEVRSVASASALSGTLAVDPLRVRRGRAEALAATLHNRGDLAMNGVQSVLRVIVPGTTTVLGEWIASHDLAAGATVDIPASFDTTGRELRDYLVVLSARVGNEERVLAQKPFWIEDVVFSGTLDATPADVVQGNDESLIGAVRNTGNLAATGSTVKLVVVDATTQQPVREWSYPANLAAGGTHAVNEVLNTQPLPLGDYEARLSIVFEEREQPLAQDRFTVRNYRISGVFDADPAEVKRGEPVDLRGVATNSGNLAIDPLPLRIEVVKVDTGATVLSLDDSTALDPQANFTMLRRADTTTFAPGEYEGVFSAYFAGEWHVLATDRFNVIQPIEIEIGMELPRDGRVLVLLSCSEQQAQATGLRGGHAQTLCEQQRQQWLSQYLTDRGIEHKIVLDQDSFMRELRCGHYNVFWFSGGAVKLGVAEAIEVRESIYRGDGFIVEGDNDQRNSQFDEMLGLNFRGHHSTTNLAVTGSASLFPAVSVPSYGRALKLELTTGTVEARFEQVAAPAIVGSSYGQGRALSYAFDLVESLRRDGTQAATERLLMNGLVRVTPQLSGVGYPVGAYVPVTTTLQNLGIGFDARLETEVDAPAAIASSSPQASEGDAHLSAWNFAISEGERRSFDVNVLTGGADPTPVRSQIFERTATALQPLGNASVEIDTYDAAAAGQALLSGLQAASLHGGEAAARQRALTAIESARSADAAGRTEDAIAAWLKASDEVRRITSVSHAEWRLAIARLLAVTQHRGCNAAIGLCGTTPSAATAFDASAFQSAGVLARAQSGGAALWEWQLADRGDAASSLRVNLDWSRNKLIDFLLDVDANGVGRLELRQSGELKATVNTDAATHGRLPLGDALQLILRNSPDVGNSKIRLANLSLNGQAVAGSLESSSGGALAEARMSLFQPGLTGGLRLKGTVQLDYTGNAPPEGSRLEFEIASGQLQCNGGAQ